MQEVARFFYSLSNKGNFLGDLCFFAFVVFVVIVLITISNFCLRLSVLFSPKSSLKLLLMFVLFNAKSNPKR